MRSAQRIGGILVLAVVLLTVNACGGAGSVEELYSVIDTWTVANAAGSDFQGGMSLCAINSFVVCAAIGGPGDNDDIVMYDVDDGSILADVANEFTTPPDQPAALSMTGGYLYVADKNNNRIVKKSVVPVTGGESLIRNHTYLAYGLASDSSYHYILWFNGSGNDLLEKTNLAGTLKSERTLSGANDGGQALGVDSAGNVYMADIGDSVIRKFDGNLDYVASFGGSELSSPFDLTVNSYDEVLVINDMTEVAVYDTSGNYKGSFGSFVEASGIAAYGDYVYVADYNNNSEKIYRLQRN